MEPEIHTIFSSRYDSKDDFPACYGLWFQEKGLLIEGFDADICIFDADKIIDHATYSNCTAKTEGLNYVIINGHIVAIDAEYTGIRAGQFLRTID